MQRIVLRLKQSDRENRLLERTTVLKFPQLTFPNRPEANRRLLKTEGFRGLLKQGCVLVLRRAPLKTHDFRADDARNRARV